MSRLHLCASACLALWACDADDVFEGDSSPQALHARSSRLSDEQVENLILLERVVEKLDAMGALEITTAPIGGAGRVIVCLDQRAISRSKVRACLDVALLEGDLHAYLDSRRAIREQLR